MNRFWNVKIETRPLKVPTASSNDPRTNSPSANAFDYAKVHERERRLFHIKIIDDDLKPNDYLAEDVGLFEDDATDTTASSGGQSPSDLVKDAENSRNGGEEDNIDDIEDDVENDDEEDFSSSFKIRASKTNQFISNEVLD